MRQTISWQEAVTSQRFVVTVTIPEETDVLAPSQEIVLILICYVRINHAGFLPPPASVSYFLYSSR